MKSLEKNECQGAVLQRSIFWLKILIDRFLTTAKATVLCPTHGHLAGPTLAPVGCILGCDLSASSCSVYSICFLSLDSTSPALQTLVSLQSPALRPFPSSFPSSSLRSVIHSHHTHACWCSGTCTPPHVSSPLCSTCVFSCLQSTVFATEGYQTWSKCLLPFKKQVV